MAQTLEGGLEVSRDQATREIDASSADEAEKFRRRIERDHAYLAGLAHASAELGSLLTQAQGVE
jgi:hypothetical protein